MNYQMFLSKKIGVDRNFVPPNLVKVDSKYNENMMLEATTYEHWQALKEKIASKGYIIEIQSGYRSYDYQQEVLDEEIANVGSELAYNAVALPGHSEHQTGLALDYCIMRGKKFIIEQEIDKCAECSFTNNIAHEYGFILRYPKGKENITGYQYEPWHLRYVGKELATYLYEKKITLDEYYEEN